MYESYIYIYKTLQNYMLFVFSSTSILEICGLDKQIPADSSPEKVPRIRPLKRGQHQKERQTFSNHSFSGDMLVFSGLFQVLLSMSFYCVIPQPYA